MDPLSQLPGELIDRICEFLPNKQDIQRLRLCCKRLKESSSHAFDVQHFGLVRVMITRASLQQLIDRTKDERFRRVIHELSIIQPSLSNHSKLEIGAAAITPDEIKELEEITSYKMNVPEDLRSEATENDRLAPCRQLVLEFERKLRRKRRRLHDKHMHDLNRMRTTSTDVALLAEALQGLPALRTIKLKRSSFNFHSPSAFRDLRDDIGIRPPVDLCSHIVPLLFGALLRSGCQPETLEFNEVRYILTLPKTPSSRRPTRSSTPAATFALSQFEDLKLTKLRRFELMMVHDSLPPPMDILTFWNAPPFLHMSGVQELVLKTPTESMGQFNLLVPVFMLPQLRVLEIRRLDFRQLADLKQMLLDHRKTLTRLILGNIRALDVANRTVNDHTTEYLARLSHIIYAEYSPPPTWDSTVQCWAIDEKTPEDFQLALKKIVEARTG